MRIGRFLLAGLLVAAVASGAQAGVRIGVGIGLGFPCYRPCYYGPYPYPYYYYPAPVVVPAPVVAAPVVVAAPTAVVAGSAAPAPAAPAAPTAVAEGTTTVPPLAPVARGVQPVSSNPDVNALSDPSAQVRAEASIRLGRSKDRHAVAPLVRVLQDDSSPAVREAAARALGLIGAPSSLSALQNAAQADEDRDVRRSASFAAEVIRSNMRR
jgi:hypothetical protein